MRGNFSEDYMASYRIILKEEIKMAKFKIDFDTVGKYVKKGCELAAYGFITVMSVMATKDAVELMARSTDVTYIGNVGYSDVFSAIMNSDMMSSYKKEAAAILPKDGDSELYKAVIHVLNSDMMSSSKLETIRSICENK